MRDGERQVSPTLDGIRADNKARYEFAPASLAGVDSVIDRGRGVGYGSRVLARGTKAQVFAFDVDAGAIEYAKQHYGVPDVEFARADAAEYRAALVTHVDAAVCFEMIEHVENPEQILKNLAGMTDKLIC